MNNGTLLVSIQGLNKGQTLDIIKADFTITDVKPHGYNKVYSIPTTYIKLPGEDIDYPRCQEIASLWMK